jgi:CBS domain-containing membrane protein
MIARLSGFVPLPLGISAAERLRGAIGAAIGIAATGLVSTLWMGQNGDLPLLIAPMGASAVLLFAVPASPLAQPWSIIGGNLIAALIGVAVAQAVDIPLLAASIAIGATVAMMILLRCVHPPSGAIALTAVLGGPHIRASGFDFVAVPVLLNSALLTISAIVYNNATGRSYPHRPHAPAHPHPPRAAPVLTDADFDAVLADYGEALDIDRDDLKALYTELRGRAEQRRRAS